MNLCLLTYATDTNHPGCQRFLRTANKHGWSPVVVGEGEQWKGFGQVLPAVRATLPALARVGFTHVVYSDSYDVLVYGSPEEFIEKMTEFFSDVDVVLSAELNCWPDKARAHDYPPPVTPWQYVNGGGFVGRIDKLLPVLGELGDDSSSQRVLTRLHLDRHDVRTAVGCYCRLFQTLLRQDNWDRHIIVKDGRVYNSYTQTYPVFVHGNGRTPMDHLPE